MRKLLILVLFLIALPLHAAVFTVTTTADSGAGSLRQAILDANATPCTSIVPCNIRFAIPGPVPETGWFTIAPASALPIVTSFAVIFEGESQRLLTGDTNPDGPEIELDGTNAGFRSGLKFVRSSSSKVSEIVINRFGGHGIFFDGEFDSGNQVRGCYVGTDPTGKVAMPNALSGIVLRGQQGANLQFNVVSGNTHNGIYLTASGNSAISNNRIGLGAIGEIPIPNGAHGVHIDAPRVAAFGVSIRDNLIYYNRLNGVIGNPVGLEVGSNSIFDNGGLAIDFIGPEPVRPPVLESAVVTKDGYNVHASVKGSLQTKPNAKVRVIVYLSPRGDAAGVEARRFIGIAEATTDAQGHAAFTSSREIFTPAPQIYGGYVTANVIVEKTSSELSDPIVLTGPLNDFLVTNTADAGPGSLREAIERASAANCVETSVCRITFNVSPDQLTDVARVGQVSHLSPLSGASPSSEKEGTGETPVPHERTLVAHFRPESPLPPLLGNVTIAGDSQRWWWGETNPAGPEIEITTPEALIIGTEGAPLMNATIREIIVNGSKGEGIRLFAAATTSTPLVARIQDSWIGLNSTGTTAVPNASNGLHLFGTRLEVAKCVISGNSGHGIVIDGNSMTIGSSLIGTDARGSKTAGNARDGIHVASGRRTRITGGEIAFNGDDGVSTAPASVETSIQASIHDNGDLAIDVRDDGLTPRHGNNLSPPIVTSAEYDPNTGKTMVRILTKPEVNPADPPAGDFASDQKFGTRWYATSKPDPSGSGEAETPLSTYFPPFGIVSVSSGEIVVTFALDLRGQFITATTDRYDCYYEFGCYSIETSELSNAVEVR